MKKLKSFLHFKICQKKDKSQFNIFFFFYLQKQPSPSEVFYKKRCSAKSQETERRVERENYYRADVNCEVGHAFNICVRELVLVLVNSKDLL